MQESTVSKSLLRSFVPLSGLSDQQLDLLLSQSEKVHFFQGQSLLREGDDKAQHIYLIHGTVRKVHGANERLIEAGGQEAVWPIAHHFPRQFTVVAESDCSILKVNSDLLEKLLCWSQVARCLLADIAVDDAYKDDYSWIRKLLESRLFYKVPPMNIRKILSRFSEQQVKAGERIIQQGEEGSCCYLIKSGAVQVDKDGETIAQLQLGDVFGEDALVSNKPRNATVTALQDCSLLVLEKKDFFQLLIQPPVTMVAVSSVAGFLDSGAQLLDVRTEEEFDLSHHKQAINLPVNLSWLKSSLLNKETIYITYSVSEERAKAAAYLLTEKGFQAYALQSGLNALPKEVADDFTKAAVLTAGSL